MTFATIIATITSIFAQFGLPTVQSASEVTRQVHQATIQAQSAIPQVSQFAHHASTGYDSIAVGGLGLLGLPVLFIIGLGLLVYTIGR